MANFIDRLQYYMDQQGINDNKLTVDAGLSVGLIGKAKKSGKAMNSANIEKILLAYPDLNPDWLLTGRGEMLKTKRISRQNSVEKVPVIEHNDSEFHGVSQISDLRDIPTRPRIPVDAAAGSLSVALSSVAESDCEQIPVIPTLPKYDFTIVARGDSMTPDILSGDELACRFINEKGFIQWGRTHVLDTTQGVVVKRIFDADDNIICRSSNPNYPDFTVAKTEIYHLALVVGLVRQV